MCVISGKGWSANAFWKNLGPGDFGPLGQPQRFPLKALRLPLSALITTMKKPKALSCRRMRSSTMLNEWLGVGLKACPVTLKQAFSTQLRRELEKLGLTQRQLADKAELTATAVAMIERKERIPNFATAARLCWVLDVAAGVLPGNLQ
jgi:DNA-binding XRE family transcriptional regulator